jgi:hypothetical integral membrane protein (TIGR02206 family)
MDAGSWSVFVPYSPLHAVTLAICALLIAIVAIGGRRRDSVAEARQRRTLASFALGAWILWYLWWNWSAVDPHQGLPLHVCGLMGVVAPLALLTANRWLRATMYFCAFTLTMQAFIQPVLVVGPAKLEFWKFWSLHSLILCCAVYDLVVLNFRPGWSDFTRACIVSAAYVALIIPVNFLTGANYGFVGNPPPEHALPPMVEYFGAWPGRVFIMLALVMVGYLLVLAPWVYATRRRMNADLPANGAHASTTRGAR